MRECSDRAKTRRKNKLDMKPIKRQITELLNNYNDKYRFKTNQKKTN